MKIAFDQKHEDLQKGVRYESAAVILSKMVTLGEQSEDQFTSEHFTLSPDLQREKLYLPVFWAQRHVGAEATRLPVFSLMSFIFHKADINCTIW